ncbi:ubiquitin-related domain-containing protein [Flagelloscypha sp. PMI_526]|nr:ubiquitin-related domain-containing protein [Flagelloscypha sp. PMI_526]
MSAEPEDTKPKLNLTINHEGKTITVKVRKNMQLAKVFAAAEKQWGKAPGTLKFRYGDARLKGEDTPADLDMEDEDQIDAFLGQVGGAANLRLPV